VVVLGKVGDLGEGLSGEKHALYASEEGWRCWWVREEMKRANSEQWCARREMDKQQLDSVLGDRLRSEG
jgi:hypothetical protein